MYLKELFPKDGPSAGITMFTLIASAFSNRENKTYLGMTGEITLRGQVLPVGGIKEKVFARTALKTFILCLAQWKRCKRNWQQFYQKASIFIM